MYLKYRAALIVDNLHITKWQKSALDEATSALDSFTESLIMNSIRRLSENLTVIMIAHRISTIKDCDIIIVLEEGKISSIGSCESLIKESEIFKNLAAET